MRNLKLVDAVVALHEIANTVEEECGTCRTSIEIRRAAEALHEMSLQDNKNVNIVTDIINKARE